MINPDKLFGRLGNRMFQYAYLYNQAKLGNIPDIYVQDPIFFQESSEEIKAIFSQGIGEDDRVAIHVRRGDYVRNPFYVDLTQTDYYEKAMREFPKKRFLVFSDDIEWCKAYFDGDEYDFCEEEDPATSLNLMASCDGVIMANSSFSWWGAYLSRGKVVAPRKWHPDGVERTSCPQDWVRL